jgi:deoxyguanosine kinase
MQSFSLAIEGAIGVGKTTLARLLQPRLKTDLLLETFEQNPFLSDFYADRARYAFQTQIFFLLSRYRQQRGIPATLAHSPLIADYTFDKDNLFAHLNLTGDELAVYERLHQILADNIPKPDLVIYLRADTDVLMSRIATRDRTYEREMDQQYIESLRQAYEQYFSAYADAPLLTIDTNNLNYVRDSSALAYVEGQVRAALGLGTHQKPLLKMATVMAQEAAATSAQTVSSTSRWDEVKEFLAANEAMAQVGAMLAGSTRSSGAEADIGPDRLPDRPRSTSAASTALRTAIQGAMERLQRLAHAAGVDLEQTE